jgi:septal ring factor EnvC (AmiA/AmiB activator)
VAARGRGRQVSVDIVGDAAKLERELKRAERDLQATRRQLEEMGVSTDKVSDSGERQVGTLQKLRENWKQVALAVTAAVAVLVGAYGALNNVTRSAADFEAGMSQSIAIMGHVSA